MKRLFNTLFVAAVLGSSMLTIGCSQEVAHSEKDSPTLFGGHKHEESTTTKNPDGTYSTQTTQSKSNP